MEPMAYLILQHLPEPVAGVIRSAVIIGRKAGHAIVVDDPSVSRRHAKIVKEGRHYFISDMDSRTGTRINGRTIDRERLHGGDEITIGPAKIIFRRGLNIPPDLKQVRLYAQGRFREESNERRHFDCPCGKEIEVALPLEAQLAVCGWCHQIVAIPEPVRADAATVASASTESCSVCLSAMAAEDETVTCPECGLRFHAECWAENRGCSAYGCAQVGVLDAPPSVDADSSSVNEDIIDEELSSRPLDTILSVARKLRPRAKQSREAEGDS